MKLEAAKHVEAVGAMKLEDKELTGGCNGESEEAVDVADVEAVVDVAVKSVAAVKFLNLLGRREIDVKLRNC
ncbi:hypothetical protein LXL04_011086 [Taraxacum kok-saghyz]